MLNKPVALALVATLIASNAAVLAAQESATTTAPMPSDVDDADDGDEGKWGLLGLLGLAGLAGLKRRDRDHDTTRRP